MTSLSVCSIVKNEEAFLDKMLKSVEKIADEIIIVDTGSSDKTIEIAERYNAKIFNYRWNDNFADAKNFSISKAKKDWVLVLDGDEELKNSENLSKYLNSLDFDLYIFYINHLTELNISNIHTTARLFKNNKGFKFFGRIHEHLVNKDEINKKIITDLEIHHFGFLKPQKDLIKKSERNIYLLNQEIEFSKNNLDYYYNLLFLLAKEYIFIKDWNKVINLLKECLSYKNLEQNLLINTATTLIKIFAQKEDWINFFNCAKKYLSVCKFHPDFCIFYGIYLSEICNTPENSIIFYQNALNFNNTKYPYLIYEQASITWKPLLFLGLIYLKKNELNRAKNYLERAYFFNSQVWQINYNLIIVYLKLSEKILAKDLFYKSLATLPSEYKNQLLNFIN